MKQSMIEELKTALFMEGYHGIEDFLGYEITEIEEKDTIDKRMDDIIDQMPEDIFYKFYRKYTGKASEFHNNFYFTFGPNERFPYQNGWIVIQTETEEQARSLFDILYPRKHPNDCLRCAFVYDEIAWKKTTMYAKNSNLGYGCHKTYSIHVDF